MIEIVEPKPSLLLKAYRDAVGHYYSSRTISTYFAINRKEFGYSTDPLRKIEKRYVLFKNDRELNKFLRETKPFYVSYSVSDWMYPSKQDVEEKVHLSSELVFDFDDDEFLTYAQSDIIVCGDEYYTVRSAIIRGLNPLVCQDGTPAKIVPIPSYGRFRAVVREAKRLLDLLKRDFGIDDNDVNINYSGKRGLHVHVTTDIFDGMDIDDVRDARLRIADYIQLTSLNLDIVFTARNGVLYGPAPDDGGKLGMLVRRLINKLKIGKNAAYLIEPISDPSLRNKTINYIARAGIDNVVKGLEEGVYGPDFLAPVWRMALLRLAREHAIPIDANTLVDVNRLIRLPNTIHGGTGLVAKTIPVDQLDRFDPFTDAVGLGKIPRVKLRVRYLPEFSFGGEEYGPYENDVVELPFYVAAYLIGVFEAWEVEESEDGA